MDKITLRNGNARGVSKEKRIAIPAGREYIEPMLRGAAERKDFFVTKRMKLADIAREAGVSTTAVSFYINGKARQYKLSKETCERIGAVVRKYDFVPNLFARAMQHNRTYLIGVVICDRINASFWSDIIAGMEQEVAPCRYNLLLSTRTGPESEREAVRLMRSKGVDAYAVCPVTSPDGNAVNGELFQKLAAERPVITLNRAVPGVAGVYHDELSGGRLAADALLDAGLSRLALFGKGFRSGLGRLRGFLDRCAERGIEPFGLFEEPGSLMAAAVPPAGVFCFSDRDAMLLSCAVTARGLRVPEELSLVGYDGVEWSEMMVPKLTTIRQFKTELGIRAARRLIAILEEGAPDDHHHEVLQPVLQAGGSVRAPASGKGAIDDVD